MSQAVNMVFGQTRELGKKLDNWVDDMILPHIGSFMDSRACQTLEQVCDTIDGKILLPTLHSAQAVFCPKSAVAARDARLSLEGGHSFNREEHHSDDVSWVDSRGRKFTASHCITNEFDDGDYDLMIDDESGFRRIASGFLAKTVFRAAQKYCIPEKNNISNQS